MNGMCYKIKIKTLSIKMMNKKEFDVPPLLSLISLVIFLSIEDDSELSKASAESGVLPVELLGEEPSLRRLKSVDFPSEFEFTIDHGRGFGAIVGPDFNLDCFEESVSSKIKQVLHKNKNKIENKLKTCITTTLLYLLLNRLEIFL